MGSDTCEGDIVAPQGLILRDRRGRYRKKHPCAMCGREINPQATICWGCYDIKRGAREWRCADCGKTINWGTTRCMACYRKKLGCDNARQLALLVTPRQRHCRLCQSLDLPVSSHHCLPCVERERVRLRTVIGGDVATIACGLCGADFPVNIQELARGNGRFCSKACYQRWRAANNPEIPSKRYYSGRREDLDGRYFRSRWEANWARYLNWLQELGEIQEWDYECQEFEFHEIKRGVRFYLPDFKVTNKDGSVEFHEVKGQMTANSKTKLARMRRYYPDVVVKIIDEDAYRSIAREVGRRLTGWE